jgi:hypothetical protein
VIKRLKANNASAIVFALGILDQLLKSSESITASEVRNWAHERCTKWRNSPDSLYWYKSCSWRL